MWPSSSPDISPMDFAIYSILKSDILAKSYSSFAALKEVLLTSWSTFDEELVRISCHSVTSRLEVMVKAKRGKGYYPVPDGKCGNPRDPKSGFMFCDSNSDNDKTCTGRCSEGFAFHGGDLEKIIRCSGSTGLWLPSDDFPECLPIGDYAQFSKYTGSGVQKTQHSKKKKHSKKTKYSKKTTITKTKTTTHEDSFSSGSHGSKSFEESVDSSHINYGNCPVPPSPRDGSINCEQSNGVSKCVGRCNSGHYFPDGQTIKNLQCSADNGIWSPSTNFPDCEPSCEPRCENDGKCIGYNQCLCTPTHRGIACQYPMSSQKRKVPENGDVSRKTARCSAQQVAAILDSDDEETLGFDEDYPFDELETDSDDNVDNDNDSESDSDNENPADRLPVRPVIGHNLDSGWNKKYVGVNKHLGNITGEHYHDFTYCPQPTGQFPHPEYCSLFLNCYNDRAYIQECPSGLFFNDAIKGCDYPNNVDCGSRWTTGASSVFTTSGSKVTTDHAGSSSSGEHYHDFTYCPQPTGQFPHPEYCSLFLNCYNDRAYIQECPSSLFFNDAIKGCDYPNNVDCGSRWTTGASSVFTTSGSKVTTDHAGSSSSGSSSSGSSSTSGSHSGSETLITSGSHQSIIKTSVTDSGEHYIDFTYCLQPTGQFPHPEYCSLFLNCYNNRAYIQECPSGLFFNDAIKGCDYPKNVDCGSRWKTGASSVFTTRKGKLTTFDGGSYSSHTTITTTITNTGETIIDYSYCPQPFGYFPHPDLCAVYLNCHHNNAYVEECPEGKLFSDISNTCVFIKNVNCGKRWYSGSSKSDTITSGSDTDSETLITSGSHISTIKTFVTESGSKKLIDQLSQLGFSVKYDRVLELEKEMDLAMCKQFEAENVVCPSNLKKNIFTVGALDNMDHNLSSTSASSSFHGTDEMMQWVSKDKEFLDKDNLVKGETVSWAAYHAARVDRIDDDPPVITAMLPLFSEKADNPAMKNALWNVLRDLLQCSGWSEALVEAEIATSGTADSFLKVSHITRTRHAQQVTALALETLQHTAYVDQKTSVNFESWRLGMIESSPTFQFWDIILHTELSILAFIRAHRENKKQLFAQRGNLESIPPAQDAILLHVQRTAYQTGIWATCRTETPDVPTPDKWGWKILDDEMYIDFSYCPQPNGHFAHPEFCMLFLNCYNNRAYVQPCAEGLFFNDVIKGCDNPANVNCGSRWTTKITTTSSTSSTSTHGKQIIKTHDVNYKSKITTETSESGETMIDFSYCPHPLGTFVHPEHCALYLRCRNHKAFVKRCPADTYFSEESSSCEPKQDVVCGHRNSAGCATDSGVCQRKLIILIEPDKFVLQNGINGVEFYHNDALVTIPSSVKGLIVEQMSRKYYMVTHSGLDFRLIWDGELAVIVGTLNFNSRLKGKTCGLCGRYDEDLKNELEIPNGKIAKTVSLFVSSWQEPNLGEHCKDDIIVEHPCEKQNKIIAVEATKVCDILLDVKYKECHDVTVTCQSPTVYVECRSSCPKTCYNDISDCKEETCVDGCECPKGTVLHDGKCIQRADCPCKYNGKEFDSGSYAYKDCNKCICNKGSWECTVQECSSSCSAIGDPHYTTFDGKHYNFMGKCSYYLVKSEDISITQENVPCNGAISEKSGFSPPPKALPSCTNSVTISIKDGTKLHLKQGLEVVELYNGMKILWDGDSRVYITSPPDLQKTTQGLCGNFNHKQNDDFLTPEGDTEIEVNAFANKWKVQSSCDDVGGNPNPCEMFAQRKSAAEKLCNKLFSNVFTDCHDVLSPQSYYEDCMYDLCACEVDIERCLCPELSHYAHECAKRHQVLEWRSQIKECAVQCENGQTYQSCGDSCQASCQAISLSSNCKFDCVDGCNCPVGMTLSNDDECILISACPCIFNKKEYEPGYKQIRQNNLCTCTNALWECHNVTEDITGVDACSATNNMEYVDCKPQCPDLCGDTDNCVKNKYTTCKPGCKCKTGYKFDVKSNKCWKPENCPCSHGGQSYNEGEIMNENCNTCVCEHGKWTCEGNDCSAVCTIWGASNYHTFDGRIFDFYGDCDYILAKGNVDANTAFSISAENVPCGTTGVTCTKSVAMSVGDKKLSLKPDQTDYPVSDTFEVVEKGLFVIVHTNIGISLHWDKKTRVYVKAAPIWKSKIKGLCGNFDDNENNDFRPPNGDIECTKVEDFAESWKIHDYCPVAEQGKAMCEVHSERKNWAYKRCSVLKSDLFSECHSTVPVDEYFNRCVDDTCGCDTGGDCDCLCTAIGIYAHMCNLNGIVINWRSQELCPIQCEHPCDIYNPCLTTCPPITCKNINDSNVRDCQSDVCVEGCEAKACEPGQIFNNLKEMKCVPVDECSFNCTLENGDVYRNGERIVDPNQDP
ncbi:SCO-spondin [Nymphon striatum]|nr:SCO-spondin [Nymphon striatum]